MSRAIEIVHDPKAAVKKELVKSGAALGSAAGGLAALAGSFVMSTAEAFILGFACCLLVYAFVATTIDPL